MPSTIPTAPVLPTDSQLASPLFRLPPEIRQQIYRHVLIACDSLDPAQGLSTYPFLTPWHLSLSHSEGPHACESELHSGKHRFPVEHRAPYPQLLRTCRRVHAEALPVLYDNVFTAHPTLLGGLPYFVSRERALPESARGRVGRWTLYVRMGQVDPPWTRAQVEAWCMGAREVRLLCVGDGSVGIGRGRMGGGEQRSGQSEEGKVYMYRCVLGLFEGVRGVGRARVCGAVDGRYAVWLERRMEMPPGWIGGEEWVDDSPSEMVTADAG